MSLCTVNPVLSGHSKRTPKLVFNADYRLMQVKIIAEYIILCILATPKCSFMGNSIGIKMVKNIKDVIKE